MPDACAELAFTPRVRADQKRFGSAGACARVLSPERDDGVEPGPREAVSHSAPDA